MNPATLSQQAAQANAQGQQMLSQYQNTAAQSTADYGNYQNQANTANQNLQQYTDYMKNAGNPLNLYNTGVSQAQQAEGFDPTSLATATQNLIKQQNALGAVNQASQSSTGGYGLSGAQLGNYYATQSQPLQGAIGAQNNAVGNLQQLYQNSLTQGQQGAALGFQGEQQVSGNLNQVYQNALSQAAQAQSNMQFYSDLAQKQGGLNAQQQQYYAESISTLQQAQAAMQQAQAYAQQASAQSALLQSQTAGQNITNTASQAQLNANNVAKNAAQGVSLSNVGVPGSVQLQGSNNTGMGAGAIRLQ